MTDNYSGQSMSDPQSKNIRDKVKARSYLKKEDSEKKKDKSRPTDASTLYDEGIKLMEKAGFVVELSETGSHVKHRILRKSPPPEIKGISFPGGFTPLQDIYTMADIRRLESVFQDAPNEIRDFWSPLYRPKPGDTDLANFTERLLAMRRIKNNMGLYDVLDYGHSFDPSGELCGYGSAYSPRIWVPAKSWFDPALQNVKFEDVFTLFPKAEIKMLTLLLGRVGVGRSNHQPPGFPEPVDHTARMAAVIVGKDPGLGKSTIFNGLTAALSHCGFITHTFKSTQDRFGLKPAALADVAYKDDTSMASLGKFLAAEETKILVTNGLLQAEEKFQNPDQIWPKCVLIVNSNDWDPFFAYDLDPGIIDRIKILSTYRERELRVLKDKVKGVSEGTPDMRPKVHIPYLAKKLGVSAEALYLWCLRLATDEFWKIITDKEDPSVNQLEREVRYWTTRLRIKFKADTSQAIVNAMALCSALRDGEKAKDHLMPELSPEVLAKYLKDFLFVGVDKSTTNLMDVMKERWNDSGRPSTHYYTGFREIRWHSVRISLDSFGNSSGFTSKPSSSIMKEMLEKLELRDGFRISTGISWVIGDWNNCRHGLEELNLEAAELVKHLSETQLERLTNRGLSPTSDWLDNPDYSPDRAEDFRPIMD